MSEIINASAVHNNGKAEVRVGLNDDSFLLKREANSIQFMDKYGNKLPAGDPVTPGAIGAPTIDEMNAAIAAIPTPDVSGQINTHNVAVDAHNDIRLLVSELSTKVNHFLDVDDATTDELSEVLTLIENNKGTLESLTTSKVNVSDIIDNLTTNVSNKPLSAAQGVALKALIDAIPTWAKAASKPSYSAGEISGLGTLATKNTVAKSDLESSVQTSLGKADTALQSFTESDPTVPAWAKAASKPSYSATEVGADASGTAANAVSSHNSATDAHSDIRQSVSSLSSEIANKANASHGNHVPDIETANNAKFLRNDNTWQAVTPANIGAAESSHNQAASTITAGTLAGQVVANETAVATVGTAQVRNIKAGPDDLTAGSSSLATGELYFVYE